MPESCLQSFNPESPPAQCTFLCGIIAYKLIKGTAQLKMEKRWVHRHTEKWQFIWASNTLLNNNKTMFLF